MPPFLRATCIILAVAAGTVAQAATLVDQVFENVTGSPALLKALTPADRQVIVSLLPIMQGPGGTLIDNTTCRMADRPELSVVDLRKDGQPVVFALMGNICTSGMTGASLNLVAKVDGKWTRYVDVPAIEYRILRSQVNGWPEIGLLGRYKCIGVWQFDGKVFKHARNIDEQGALCKE